MNERQWTAFQGEFFALLEKYGIKSYFLTTSIFGNNGETSVPIVCTIESAPPNGISGPRWAAVMIENAAGGLLDALQKYCGLDIPAQVGALKGMMDAQAHEKGMELLRKREQRQRRPSDGPNFS